ncbi:hypothetical protein GH714_027251 [Hevea brasiliensis]|uniref:VHS domain-containing protein n=1 Tax=Hevea brasiliensis TaxID=3981 RepID=A0A6A6KVQ8_HEVBR|nr:hypothetical protein GH714_027251 [Hevea brasiliensis]
MINCEQFSGTEIVRAIKKKISGKNWVSQKLSLDLLEACTLNCEKVFSEVASEKVLDEMVKMIENPQTDQGNRDRALQLIRAWGQSEDLEYLPVFHQAYVEDLTVSLLEKCKQSQVVIQRIIESTTDDEAMLFEALNLNDELQLVISQYELLEAGLNTGEQKALKKEHFLWQLFIIDKDIKKINDDLEAERKNGEGVMQELENFEFDASKKKKEQVKYLKETAQCDKKIAERSSKLDKNGMKWTVLSKLEDTFM